MTLSGPRPDWLTFDCYGTLIQWDEHLMKAVEAILAAKGTTTDARRFITHFDRHEHALEQEPPHRSFRSVTELALRRTMQDLGLPLAEGDPERLTGSIGRMPPFPEVVETLTRLKAAGFKLAILSNTDDEIIAGNVAQLGGTIDRVITAQQAGAYKPSAQLFEHAWRTLGLTRERFVHICASPHLDLTAARALGFRTIWIDRGTGRKALPDHRPELVLPTLAGVPDALAAANWS